jgi:hypothetical protein
VLLLLLLLLLLLHHVQPDSPDAHFERSIAPPAV